MRELVQVNMKYRALARWSCLDSGGSEDKSEPYIQKYSLISRNRQSPAGSASC